MIKKLLFTVLLMLVASIALAQTPTATPSPTLNGYKPRADSYGFNMYPFGWLPPPPGPGAGAGTIITCFDCTQTEPPTQGPVLLTPAQCVWSTANNDWNCTNRSAFNICTDLGVVTTNQTFNFPGTGGCYKVSTTTTGLTYTIHSTTSVITNQEIEIDSYITGGSITGPLWAATPGTPKWFSGSAPISSNINGYVDILFMKWNGSQWIETGEAFGLH